MKPKFLYISLLILCFQKSSVIVAQEQIDTTMQKNNDVNIGAATTQAPLINQIEKQNSLIESQQLTDNLNHNNYNPNYFSLILGLFFVVGLIYLTGNLYQKLSKVKVVKDINFNDRAKIISTTILGKNKSLHVIELNNEKFLIGASENDISFIKDVKEIKQTKNDNGKSLL